VPLRSPSKPADDDYGLDDLGWLDPASGRTHPYNWALLAACNLRDAAAVVACPHVLRLSGKPSTLNPQP